MSPRRLARLLLLLLLSTPLAASPLPLEVQRLAGAPLRLQGEQSLPLKPGQNLAAGDRLQLPAEARLGLRFAGLSSLTLGDRGQLLVHSAQPPAQGRGALLRLKLEQGALHVDGSRQGDLPVQDLRLNVGELRLRIYGAEIWAEVGERTRTVCLIRGAIEIQTPQGAQRLDQPEDCLVAGADGSTFVIRSDAALKRKRLRTAFADDAPPLAGSGWTLLAALLPAMDAAQQRAEALRGEGLPAEVTATAAGYRVTLGRYASQAAAEAYRAKLAQSRPGLGLDVISE